MATPKNLRHASQLDPGQVLKNVHDELGRSLRVSDANSKVPQGYSKVTLETNADGSVTEATFYAGTAAEKTKVSVIADVAGSLNSTSFRLNNADDDPMSYVWYNVDGTGVDPDITDVCGIEVPISANDSKAIVALATAKFVDNSEYFKAIVSSNDYVVIENIELGAATNTADVDTGFTFQTVHEGTTQRIKCITLPEEPGVRYLFNHAEGKFIISPDVSGEFVIIGLSTAQPIVEIPVPDTAWTAVPVTVTAGETMAIGVQNQDSATGVKLNWGSDPGVGSNVGMQIYPNGGERQYVIKNNVTMYLRSLGGTVTISLEVIS